jgi:hypothetical protein
MRVKLDLHCKGREQSNEYDNKMLWKIASLEI